MTPSPAHPFPAPGAASRCPCLSGETYANCCGRFHSGEAAAPTAERLMRARYCAFVVGDVQYLLRTWHPDTRPPALRLEPDQRWIGLDIVRSERGGMLDTTGIVEFTARFRQDGAAFEQHEISRFAREAGRWVYVEAQ